MFQHVVRCSLLVQALLDWQVLDVHVFLWKVCEIVHGLVASLVPLVHRRSGETLA